MHESHYNFRCYCGDLSCISRSLDQSRIHLPMFVDPMIPFRWIAACEPCALAEKSALISIRNIQGRRPAIFHCSRCCMLNLMKSCGLKQCCLLFVCIVWTNRIKKTVIFLYRGHFVLAGVVEIDQTDAVDERKRRKKRAGKFQYIHIGESIAPLGWPCQFGCFCEQW